MSACRLLFSWAITLVSFSFATLTTAVLLRHPATNGEPSCWGFPVVILSDRCKATVEIEEMYSWGLRALGHPVTVRTVPACNMADATHGQAGARACALAADYTRPDDHPRTVYLTTWYCSGHHGSYDRLPAATIIAQLEPVPLWDGPPCFDNATYLTAMGDKVIWDYAALNLRHFNQHVALIGTEKAIIPFFAYPGITSMDFSAPAAFGEAGRDIDVFFLGGTGSEHGSTPRRGRILQQLRDMGLRVLELNAFVLSGVDPYSKEVRDSYLRRAKVVLNIHRAHDDVSGLIEQSYEDFPLEVVRLQYLLAAHSFVISETSSSESTQPFRASGSVVFAPYSRLVETVLDWLARPAAERQAVADRGYEYIYSRSMADVLREPMARAILRLHGTRCS